MRLIPLLFLFAAVVPGEDTSKQQEQGKALIAEALQALGGEKFTAMENRVEEGRSYSFYADRLSGLSRTRFYVRYLTRPEPPKPDFIGVRERRASGKKEDVYVLYNEDGGWDVTYRGAKPLPPEVVAQYHETLFHNILYTLRMRLGEPGLIFESAGADIIEHQPCIAVDVIDSANRVTRVWLSQTTKLPVRQKWDRRDPKTRERDEEVTVFDKYRDVGGGVMWPFTVRRERNGERIFEMYADAVTINQNLSDSLFTLPAGVPVLDTKGSAIKGKPAEQK